ncbi:MAG: hypothetical protein LBK82_11640 [Planctomycetaceae bacterium]|nr:hypothetical protein [Planctomycetaceae bacterium]
MNNDVNNIYATFHLNNFNTTLTHSINALPICLSITGRNRAKRNEVSAWN